MIQYSKQAIKFQKKSKAVSESDTAFVIAYSLLMETCPTENTCSTLSATISLRVSDWNQPKCEKLASRNPLRKS